MSQPVWNDELRAEAKSMYLEQIMEFAEDDRPEKSTSVVESIAEVLGFSKNSVRIILSKMKNEDGTDVYIRAGKKPKAAASGTSTGTKRVSKADAHKELKDSIVDGGGELPEDFDDVIKALTGKAALAIAGAIRSMQTGE